MFRGLLFCAGLATFLAPALTAQNTICVFQAKQGPGIRGAPSDADGLLSELNTRSLQAVAVVGIPKNRDDAEAQKRNCSWIISVWRQELAADTPNYGGSLGGTQSANASNGVLDATRQEIGANTLLDYNLRKPGSHKNVAHGELEDASPYSKMADQIVKKISKEK